MDTLIRQSFTEHLLGAGTIPGPDDRAIDKQSQSSRSWSPHSGGHIGACRPPGLWVQSRSSQAQGGLSGDLSGSLCVPLAGVLCGAPV